MCTGRSIFPLPSTAPGWGLDTSIILPNAREPCSAGGSGSSSNLHINTPSMGLGARPALSTAVAAHRGSLLRRGLPNASPGSPRDTAPSKRLAGCEARHGRRKSAGRQAAKPCTPGHLAGLGGFPDLGRESIGPPAPGHPAATGQQEEQDPEPQGTQGCGCHGRAVLLPQEHRDRLGHCRWLDTTPGTKSRPTEHSGHRRESWL